MTQHDKIAFLGIGLMGLPMAKNLLKAGYNLSVWNRTPEKAQPLQALGATLTDHSNQAVKGASMIISMVSDGHALMSLIDTTEMKAALSHNAIWVDMSSTKPDDAKNAATLLANSEVSFVDAPVSGGTKGAEAATLAIMAGANETDFAAVSPVLAHLGRPVHVGPVGSGQLAKLANQMIVASTIGAVAEAMLLLEQGGANPEAVRNALQGGFADSTILQQHGARMTQRDFAPGGLSKLQLKDLDNALQEAGYHDLQLPMTQQVRDRFARYVNDLNGAEKDHSGLYEELLDRNKL